MGHAPRIAIVGSGRRSRSHLRYLYQVRAETHRDRTPDDHRLDNPQHIYDAHATDVPAWAESTDELDAMVAAIVDPDADARRQAVRICEEHGDDPDTYADVSALLEEARIDAAIVGSPNYTHADVAIPILEAGIDVFCEKPLATTLADHDRFIEADQRTDALLFVGFNMRSSPVYTRLYEMVRAGDVGEVSLISVRETRMPFPQGHYYDREESGGSILEKDSHDFDLFNWILDADPVRVGAFGRQHVFDADTDTVDAATVNVEYDSGAMAALELCLHAPFGHNRGRDFSVRGSDGLIRTPEESGAWELYTRETHDTIRVSQTGGGHGGADLRQMRRFLRCLRGEAERVASPEDAKKAAAVALGAHRSIDEGEMVGIDDEYDLVY